MAMFFVLATRGAISIGSIIESKSDELKHFKIKDDAWLVKYKGTARELSALLGLKEGKNGSGMVVQMASYSGRAPRDIWDWLTAHSEDS